MGIFGIFGSCGKALDKPPPEITSGPDEGWHDLTLAIRHSEKLTDGSQALHAYGVHHGRKVGVIVVLSPEWPKASFDQKVPFTAYKGVVTYRSVGPASDALVQIIDELYGTGLHPTSMRAEIKITGISLEGRPDELKQGPVKIKLFYESDAEDRYAELFTNIDFQKSVLEINEKDEDYRKPVMRALIAQ